MARLIRPPISDHTKLAVVLRQLGEMFPTAILEAARKTRTIRATLTNRLCTLADLLGCEVADLRCDHDPALGARQKVFNDAGEHVDYVPAGSDPEFLFYRPHGAKYRKSHDIKTRVRGDHGQLSDIALVKRNRRQEEREGTRPKSARTRARERRAEIRAKRPKVKQKMRSASRWPPKGSRKLGWKR